MTEITKNQRIKETYAATMAKRSTQSCRVYTVKVQNNKLNRKQQEHLKMLFVEAKWLYNHVLNLSKGTSVFNLSYKDLGTVIHYDKDRNQLESELHYLSSQMRQAVYDGICSSIKGLSRAKAKGNKVGELKFISEYTSINLKQANVSYKITHNGKIKLQGLKKPIRVRGIEQILSLGAYDLANAKLIQRNGDYYVAITVYVAKDNDSVKPKERVGIDLGCKTCVTLSNGEKHECRVEETEHIKELRRKISRSVKGSNNRRKLCLKLRKKEQELVNKRNDFANKLCHILSDYVVVMQDEQLSSWAKRGHGKAVSYGVLGRVKDRLMDREDTIVLSKWCPTTKLCTECGMRVSMKLSDRTFVCPQCGHTHDRDVHAAENMLWFAENNIGVGRTVMLVEILRDIANVFSTEGMLDSQEAAESSDWR